jgi:hypothetical protein
MVLDWLYHPSVLYHSLSGYARGVLSRLTGVAAIARRRGNGFLMKWLLVHRRSDAAKREDAGQRQRTQDMTAV